MAAAAPLPRPWRAHPGVAFLFRRQDHRHGFRMDLLNVRVRLRLEEAVVPVSRA
jgi:hypothetical protein